LPATFTKTRGEETIIDAQNGAAEVQGKVGLGELRLVEAMEGKEYEYEAVGLVEDEEHHNFAVWYSKQVDDELGDELASNLAFFVTDDEGTPLADDALAQEILDDFFVLAEESASEEG
jgi:hypothetical protein